MTPLTFSVDETYGPNLVDLLREKDLHAVTYRNACDINPGDPDVRWIPNVASRQWVAVTADKQIRRKQAEREAVQNAQLRLIVIAASNQTEAEAVCVISKHRNSVLALIRDMSPPYIISLTRQRLEFDWLGAPPRTVQISAYPVPAPWTWRRPPRCRSEARPHNDPPWPLRSPCRQRAVTQIAANSGPYRRPAGAVPPD